LVLYCITTQCHNPDVLDLEVYRFNIYANNMVVVQDVTFYKFGNIRNVENMGLT